MTLWFDVEDVFSTALHDQELTSVQRAGLALHGAMEAIRHELGLQVGYVRIDPATARFAIVAGDDVRALHGSVGRKPGGVLKHPAEVSQSPDSRQRIGGRAGMLPQASQAPFRRFATLQVGALQALRSLALGTVETRTPEVAASNAVLVPAAPGRLPSWATGWLDETVTLDDWLLSPATSCHRRDHGSVLRGLRQRCALRVGVMLNDLAPIFHPEWYRPALAADFEFWLRDVLPQADRVFLVSQAGARDLRRFSDRADLVLRRPAIVLPLASSLDDNTPSPEPAGRSMVSGPYVLCVSEIDGPGNQVLLLRVWRWLLARHAADRTPRLVLAGRIGELVEDLIDQLNNANYLNGKIVLIEDASAVEVNALYANCLFTVVPSLHDIWQMPATESLAHGKPCLVSGAVSLSEAEARFVRRFDPADFTQTCALVATTLGDPEALARWEAEVRQGFQPRRWTDCARILAGHLLADGAPAVSS